MARAIAVVAVVALLLAHVVAVFAGHGGGEILRAPTSAAGQR